MHIWLYGSCDTDLGRSIEEVTDNTDAIGLVKPVISKRKFWYKFVSWTNDKNTREGCPLKIHVSPDETKFDKSKIHKTNWTAPYTVNLETIDLHNQISVV